MAQNKKNRLLWFLCLAALAVFGAAMVWLHYQQLCSPGGGDDPYTSDLGQHLYFAQQGMIYSTVSLLIGPAYDIAGRIGIAVLLAVFHLAAVAVFAWGLRAALPESTRPVRLLVSLAVNLATAVWMPRGGYWYQGTVGGTIYHNTTYIMLAPFALLTMLAFLLVDGKSRTGWYWGLVFYALAIGCRPFNIALAPAVLWVFGERLANGEKFGWRLVGRAVPFCVAPFLIGCAYGCYNLARFGSFFQFGHDYLPEFVQSGEPMFSLRYFARNVRSLLRMPAVWRGWDEMPSVSGFAVWLTQPGLFLALGWFIFRALRGKITAADAVLAGCVAVQACALMLHRTNGGWQYGARYLCDTLPAVVYLRARADRDARPWEAAALGGAAMFNLLAGAAFHAL